MNEYPQKRILVSFEILNGLECYRLLLKVQAYEFLW